MFFEVFCHVSYSSEYKQPEVLIDYGDTFFRSLVVSVEDLPLEEDELYLPVVFA